MSAYLQSGLLDVPHGFGTRQAVPPAGLRRPRQVHGARVARVGEGAPAELGEADAVVCDRSGVPVGVVTADCVPILAAGPGGRAVAAIHGGWRGLAAGVVEAGIGELRALAPGELVAAIGPHVGPCCYEVDEPVLAALEERFGGVLGEATRSSRPGHVWLDLGIIARAALRHAGVSALESLPGACTACPGAPYFSVRRDGADTGRLVHWIEPAGHPGLSPHD